MAGLPTWISSLSPARCRWVVALLLVTGFVAHLVYLRWGCPIDLSADEAQYWDWSRQLQGSYYSKGPGIAYLIRASCSVWGETMFGVRFPALLCSVGTMLCFWWITRKLFESDRLALVAVVMCHLIWMFVAGSVLLTIDPPYFLCWALATCLAVKALWDGSRWAWPMMGAMVGVGFLFKYAMPLWLIGLLLFMVMDARSRRWLKTPWPWVMVGVMGVCMWPVIGWNIQNDWIAFGHVARQTSDNQSKFNLLSILRNYAELFGSQIAILNPAIAILMIAAIVQGMAQLLLDPPGHRGRTITLFLLCMSLPFFVCVSVIPIFKTVEANWPAPTYFALVPLTVGFLASRWNNIADWRAWRGVVWGAIVLGVGMIPFIHDTTLIYPIARHFHPKANWDPVRRLYGNAELGAIVSREARAMGGDTLIIGQKYGETALLSFYVEGHPRASYIGSWLGTIGDRDRLCQYDLWPERSLDRADWVGRSAIVVGYDMPDIRAAFERMEPVENTKIYRRGVEVRHWRVWRAYGFKGMKRPTDGLTPR